MSADGPGLDARQRAMLEEMGVKLFWWRTEVPAEPMAAPTPEVQPPVAAPPQVREAPTPAPAVEREVPRHPAAAPVRPAAPASPVPAHGAPILADAPRRLYGDEDASTQGWLVVADMPPEADGRHGEPLSGDAGRLLDAMLRALGLHQGSAPVHLVRVHRGVASGQPGSPRPLSEVLVGPAAVPAPRLVLAMGPLAAQGVLQSGEPLGKLRGRVLPVALPGMPDAAMAVATYPPAYLLRNPADKGKAWADLCLAAEQVQPAAAT